jgi:hypothetical protein
MAAYDPAQWHDFCTSFADWLAGAMTVTTASGPINSRVLLVEIKR